MLHQIGVCCTEQPSDAHVRLMRVVGLGFTESLMTGEKSCSSMVSASMVASRGLGILGWWTLLGTCFEPSSRRIAGVVPFATHL